VLRDLVRVLGFRVALMFGLVLEFGLGFWGFG
jgi:hypothetical protein